MHVCALLVQFEKKIVSYVRQFTNGHPKKIMYSQLVAKREDVEDKSSIQGVLFKLSTNSIVTAKQYTGQYSA